MQESQIDWLFKGPACLVLIINLVFLFCIMWVRNQACDDLFGLVINHFFRPVGAYNETEVRQHCGNETVSESFESTFGSHSTFRSNIFDRPVWTE